MEKAYIQQENGAIRKVLNETYNELLAAAQIRNPKAKTLIEEEDYSKLHDLFALLKLGYIDVHSGENEEGCYISLKVILE